MRRLLLSVALFVTTASAQAFAQGGGGYSHQSSWHYGGSEFDADWSPLAVNGMTTTWWWSIREERPTPPEPITIATLECFLSCSGAHGGSHEITLKTTQTSSRAANTTEELKNQLNLSVGKDTALAIAASLSSQTTTSQSTSSQSTVETSQSFTLPGHATPEGHRWQKLLKHVQESRKYLVVKVVIVFDAWAGAWGHTFGRNHVEKEFAVDVLLEESKTESIQAGPVQETHTPCPGETTVPCTPPIGKPQPPETTSPGSSSSAPVKSRVVLGPGFPCALDWGPTWRNARLQRYLGDADGDGIQDVYAFGYNGVYLARSYEYGTKPNLQRILPEFGYLGGWKSDLFERTIADVNGDGRHDIVAFGKNGTWVSLSASAPGTLHFAPPIRVTTEFGWNTGWRVGRDFRTLADANGDGKLDIVALRQGRVWISLSQSLKASANFSPPYLALSCSSVSETFAAPSFADVNGDGRADLVLKSKGRLSVALSLGGFLPQFSAPQTVLKAEGTGVLPGFFDDTNGDRKADWVTSVDGKLRILLSKSDQATVTFVASQAQ